MPERNRFATPGVPAAMTIPIRPVFAAAILATFVVACASAAPAPSEPVDDSPPAGNSRDADGILRISSGIASGPGITIEDALGRPGAEPLLVNGSLFVDGDRVLLCSALAESFPPQCGGSRLLVQGLDVTSIPDIQQANGIGWAERVQLLGTVALIEG